MRNLKRALGFVVSVVALSAFSDSWLPGRPRAFFSPDVTRFVRIIPGTDDVLGLQTGKSDQSRWGKAEFYARRADRSYGLVGEAHLRNPVAPADAAVSDDGWLVTVDNWGALGYGEVVAIYTPRGDFVRSYRLEDLYTPAQVQRTTRTITSRLWRCATPILFGVDNPRELHVNDFRGGQFVFFLPSGRFEYRPGTNKCRVMLPAPPDRPNTQ